MSSVLPFLIVSVFLLVVLVWLLKSREEVGKTTSYEKAEEALNTLRTELLPAGLAESILGPADFDFVASEGNLQIQEEFEAERKGLALQWLRQTREQVERLFHFHLQTARRRSDLEPAFEFRIAFSYLLFLTAYAILVNSIRLRGPHRVRGMVGFATDAAERLCAACGDLLAALDPSRGGTVEGTPTDLTSMS